MKTCTKCGQTKCADDFYSINRPKDTTCTSCKEAHLSKFPVCVIPDCNKYARSSKSGYCERHYGQIRRNGCIDATVKPVEPPTCSVLGCENKLPSVVTKNTLCRKHYERNRVHGSPHIVLPGRFKGLDVGYGAAHDRIRNRRGRASEYGCVDCYKQAAHWSYDYDTAVHRFESKYGPYSGHPDDYKPRCLSCHKRLDMAHVGQR